MVKLTQFQLPFSDDFTIQGEYEGNEKSGKVIIFSHGFGVKRDSWGTFNQIGDTLKNEYLVVRFDYNKIIPKENATYTYPYSTQVRMLESVIQFIKSEFQVNQLNIIAHSMGCLITGLFSPDDIHKVILLSSPSSSPYQEIKEYFSKRPGTQISETSTSKIKRSDGSWTYIDQDFWPEMQVVDPVALYTNLVKKTQLHFIRPLQDHVITTDNYDQIKNIPGIHYQELDGDHDFSPPHRQQLLDTIKKIVSEAP